MSDDPDLALFVCPECAVGKCRNCDGTALDPVDDIFVACSCAHLWGPDE